jgi:protein O-mannosyl-transferase
VVFAQTVWHDFINYDDPNYVYENANITRGFSLSGIIWAFSHIHSENWHPLTTISHMLDCQLYGVKPGGHHLTSVLLHTAAAILLFLALRTMTGALWQSAFVAALFAIHPLHVESVAWVAERKDVLSAVFFMLTLVAYTRYTRAPAVRRYLLVALLYALGLMCKPMLVTLPFVFLLLDFWPLNRWPNQPSRQPKKRGTRSSAGALASGKLLLLEKIPLVALSLISSGVTLIAQKQTIGWIEQLPLTWRLTNAAVSYVLYVWQMLWPVKLAVFYPHPENRLHMWQIILTLAALIAMTAVSFVLRKKHPYLVTGWLWYVMMLFPVIGIIQVGWQGRADRYTYLPQIGLYVLITWGVADCSRSWRRQPEVLGLAAAIVLGVLTWRSWIQTAFWRDSQTLWTHALAVTSGNDVAENNLGIVLLAKGRVDEAISRFQTAVDLRPENAPAHRNLAKAFLEKGQVADAMIHYRKLLEIEPENVEARNTLGIVLVKQGRIKEALEQWQGVLAVEPDNGNANSNLAWVLATSPEASLRDGEKAVELAENALRLSGGNNPLVLRVLAAAYAETGRFRQAIETAQHGLELAKSQGKAGLAAELEQTIFLYQTDRPLRDPSLALDHSSP